MSAQINNIRPEFDREIVDIVDYVMNYEISSKVAYDTAHYCLLDTLGCGLEALEYPACNVLSVQRKSAQREPVSLSMIPKVKLPKPIKF